MAGTRTSVLIDILAWSADQNAPRIFWLSGMAGTGKSQVIKALTDWFSQREESYRFICLAPTGAAAVLIGGSTYHSMLGLGRDKGAESTAGLLGVHARLQHVDYIFVDEVSMVDCHGLYTICAKMCTALKNDGQPFGGVHMIFAGDFAQLPPVMAKPLYDHTVGISTTSSMTLRDQENAIGKAIWHQITTVVILKQNMRQRSQSSKDAKFRTALENMRYKSCTNEDIDFLRTLIANNGSILS